MAPNTKKQRALRRIERAVGATMPEGVYTPISLLRAVDIEAFADWLEKVKAKKRKRDEDDDDVSEGSRASVVPLDDYEA